ncbi:MAG: type VI secretion system tip protein VgrG [Casimicrobiaceae bacterium]|nr:type VI secretion system tip protein VgrG [Casimicrobiaceae bacterium]
MERIVDIVTPLGPEALWFREMVGTETISGLFEFDVTLHSKQTSVPAKALLGKPMTLVIETEGAERYLNGICTRFASAGREGEHLVYTAKLRPWLWLASRRSDCKIFQFKTVPDIVTEVLERYGFPISRKLTKSYRAWDYCVQYQETDLNFVMRLLEHEGIAFFFEHSASNHTLVLADDMSSYKPIPGRSNIKYLGIDAATTASEEHFYAWSVREQIDPGEYYSIDYDFEKPSVELYAVRGDARGHSHDSYQQFEWPGDYTELADAEAYAAVRMESLTSEQERATGTCTVRTMAPGHTFTLERCPHEDQNREYLVVGVSYFFRDNSRLSAGSGAGDSMWELRVHAHPTSLPFRPPRVTPKPRTTGPQTAVVVGPKGEEIYTDKYGRVKVQFHWDRYGRHDENSSCWIRVATPWAGERWGAIHIPRIGQEVVVDFIGGDPDRPIIVGSVYNAEQMPPYGLPDNKTASGFKSRSTKGGGANDFNEIRMEDKKGEEQLYIHAQRNLDTAVELDETHTVGRDRKTRIGRDDLRFVGRDDTHVVKQHQRNQIQGNQITSVSGDQDNTVKGDQSNMVMGSRTQSIKKTLKEKVGGDHRESIGGDHTFHVSGDEAIQIGGKQSSFVQGGKSVVVVGKYSNTATGKFSAFGAGGMGFLTPLKLSFQCTQRESKVLADDQETVLGMQTTKVGGLRDVSIGASDSLKVGGALTMTVGGASTLQAAGAISTTAGAAVTITAGGAVSITGGAAVTVQGATVTVTAATINLVGIVNVLGMLNVAGTIVTPSIVSASYTRGIGNLY